MPKVLLFEIFFPDFFWLSVNVLKADTIAHCRELAKSGQTSTTQTSEARPKRKEKKQNRRPQPRKHTKDPTLAPLFFGTMRLFLKFFGLHQRVPLHLFRYFATQWMSKNRKGSPFYIFRHCDTVQKSHLKIFLGNFFMSPKGPPFNFFFNFLQPAGVSQSPKGPPFEF